MAVLVAKENNKPIRERAKWAAYKDFTTVNKQTAAQYRDFLTRTIMDDTVRVNEAYGPAHRDSKTGFLVSDSVKHVRPTKS